MLPRRQHVFCLFGAMLTGCALPKMSTEGNDSDAQGGADALGGTVSNQGGGSLNRGGNRGLAGRSASSDASSAGRRQVGGGTNSAGQSAQLGGALTTPDAGRPGLGATTDLGGSVAASGAQQSSGGTSPVTSAGTNSVAGTSSSNGTVTAGTNNAGGATAIGGTTATGGATAIGGTPSTGETSNVAGWTNLGGAIASAGNAGTGGNSGSPIATAIAAGLNHTCAVMSDGTVRCWGSNCYGQLGNAAAITKCVGGAVYSTLPTTVTGISRATAIATGDYHSCAVDGGKVKCWGRNGYGQLGNESYTNSSSPVEAYGITHATSVIAGTTRSCALLNDKTVQCWGWNNGNQGILGVGRPDLSDSAIPYRVVADAKDPPTPFTGATQIATAYESTCARTQIGDVYCWGANDWGELATGSSAANYEPIAARARILMNAISPLTVDNIGAGRAFTCALVSNGSVRCVGNGWYGKLGDGNGTFSETPVTVAFTQPIPTVIGLTVGSTHSCAVTAGPSRNVHCWGLNGYGEIGSGAPDDHLVPAVVTVGTTACTSTALSQVQTISAGDSHTCAIVTGGAVYCWGNNQFGQLGNGGTQNSLCASLSKGI